MDFKEIFKKFWFVIIMGLALIAFVIYYAINLGGQSEDSNIKSKVVDGKSVVYSINDENYFADDLYNSLYQSSGSSVAYNIYKRNVISNLIKTTSEMETTAASYAAYILQNYGEDQVMSYIKSMGYSTISDLTNIYVDQLKEDQFVRDFFLTDETKYLQPLAAENKVRKISHILIKVADVSEETDSNGNITHTANPTEEEEAKLNEVLEALKTKSFAEVASEYSEDGSASNGGLLGVVGTYNSSNYVAEFAEESMRLNVGEISDVITTTYGYHIILAEEATNEELLEDSQFFNLIYTNNETDIYKEIYDKGQELGFEILDENLKALIEKNINGSEVNQ